MRGKEKHVENPEEYAIKNWIVRVQGFLINCATFGFTSNYNEIMNGTYKYDLFHRTFAEKLMDLLGDLAYREVFTSDAIFKMEVAESSVLNYLMNKFVSAIVKYDDPMQRLGSIDTKIVSFISNNYKRAYHHHSAGKSDIEQQVVVGGEGDGTAGDSLGLQRFLQQTGLGLLARSVQPVQGDEDAFFCLLFHGTLHLRKKTLL